MPITVVFNYEAWLLVFACMMYTSRIFSLLLCYKNSWTSVFYVPKSYIVYVLNVLLQAKADRARALSACISNPPRDWRRPLGRPRQTWLRTIEKDLQEQNLGLWTAWFYAQDRVRWRKVVETATLQYRGTRHDDDD